MKFNWGWGIVVALTLFVAMIVQFAVRSFNQRIDLVTEDYYEQELGYQETIDRKRNLDELSGVMEVLPRSEGLLIRFPEDLKGKDIEGTLFLYRPSDERLDRAYDLQVLDQNSFLIPVEHLIGGKWIIKVDFSTEGTPYYYQKEIML
jgi:hypothetical protein